MQNWLNSITQQFTHQFCDPVRQELAGHFGLLVWCPRLLEAQPCDIFAPCEHRPRNYNKKSVSPLKPDTCSQAPSEAMYCIYQLYQIHPGLIYTNIFLNTIQIIIQLKSNYAGINEFDKHCVSVLLYVVPTMV